MKAIFSLAVPGALVLALAGCNPNSGVERTTEAPQTELDKLSYALGQNMGTGLSDANITYDKSYFYAGFEDSLAGEQLMTDEEMQASITAMQQKMQQEQMEKQIKLVEEKALAALAYLDKSKLEEGMVTTESGLQYKVVTESEGEKPTATDTVSVHYEGRLIDGSVFDSSIQRGEPAVFPVNGVIAGWTEALQLMSVGSKWQLTIPPELGYGSRGAGPNIGPNEVLVFDVELLSIEKPAEG